MKEIGGDHWKTEDWVVVVMAFDGSRDATPRPNLWITMIWQVGMRLLWMWRLVKVRVGKTWMWMLTSVLDQHRPGVKQIREIYKQRWGIEVEFRALKQTLEKAELRLSHLHESPCPDKSLPAKLWRARTDNYDRNGPKAARYRPPNPDQKPLGEPQIRPLTAKEKIKLKAAKNTKITA